MSDGTSRPGTLTAEEPSAATGECWDGFVDPGPGKFLGAPGARLVIISGPSGVGKDTIIQALRKSSAAAGRRHVVTYRTRERRKGEVDGVDYHFVSLAQFRRMRREGAFLETARVHGTWSGTPRDQVVEALRTGRDAILKIDVQGAATIRRNVPQALLIFVAPPSLEALSGRLVGRATESAPDLKRRQEDAPGELARQDEYDYVVVNETGQVERTAREIDSIIAAEHERSPDIRIRL
jgi:guanylate kinase